MQTKRIVIFASGNGSNAENIIRHFYFHPNIMISAIFSNIKTAFVHERAKKYNVPSFSFSREEFYSSSKIMDQLHALKTDYIILAGFLWLVPAEIVAQFPNKIINIHPALLPKYGGKGMYGDHVHKAVIAHGEKESGITIHYVNANYDDGDIIFQERFALESNETADSLAQKIHALEYLHFPNVIEQILTQPAQESSTQ